MNPKLRDIAMSNPSYTSLQEILNEKILMGHDISVKFTNTELLDVLGKMQVKLDNQYAYPVSMGRKLTAMTELSFYSDFITKGNTKGNQYYVIRSSAIPVRQIRLRDIQTEIYTERRERNLTNGFSYVEAYTEALNKLIK
jgi:hypothetical protein